MSASPSGSNAPPQAIPLTAAITGFHSPLVFGESHSLASLNMKGVDPHAFGRFSPGASGSMRCSAASRRVDPGAERPVTRTRQDDGPD